VEVTGETKATPPQPTLPVEKLRKIQEQLAAEPEQSRQAGFAPSAGFTPGAGGAGVQTGPGGP